MGTSGRRWIGAGVPTVDPSRIGGATQPTPSTRRARVGPRRSAMARPSRRWIVRSATRSTASSWVTTIAVAPVSRDELPDELEESCGGGRVELAGRFVGEEETRAADQGGGHGHALLLAARQLPGTRLAAVAQPDPLQQRARPEDPLAASHAPDGERQGDAVPDRQVRRQ